MAISSCGVRGMLCPLVALRHCAVTQCTHEIRRENDTTMNDQCGGWAAPLREQQHRRMESLTVPNCTSREGLWVRHGRAGDGRVSALPASYKAPASRVCRRWRRQRRTCATTAAAARRTAPVDDSFTVARRPANSTAQQTSRAGGWSRADVQAHSSMAEAADVELACLQRQRPLWQARDQRRRGGCGGR